MAKFVAERLRYLDEVVLDQLKKTTFLGHCTSLASDLYQFIRSKNISSVEDLRPYVIFGVQVFDILSCEVCDVS